MTVETPKLYTELADWFHLLTRPEDYAEEAEFYRKAILSASSKPPHNRGRGACVRRVRGRVCKDAAAAFLRIAG